MPTQIWYKAYPGLTAFDLERNTRVREGLRAAHDERAEVRAWLRDCCEGVMQFSDVEYRDIQGLVRFGYRHLPEARFLLVGDRRRREGARLAQRAPVSTSRRRSRATGRDARCRSRSPAKGSQALGVAEDVDRGFSPNSSPAWPRGEPRAPPRRRRCERAGEMDLGGTGQACRTCWSCSMPSTGRLDAWEKR